MITTRNLDDLTARVDTELQAIVNERGFPLYDMMGYHMGWRGAHGALDDYPQRQERMHGALTLLACEAVGGDIDVCLPAAAALEMVEKFTQIHDDVQDGNPQRNDRDAVWWVWGPAQAINAGDGMHALGRLALLRLANRGISDERILQIVRLVDAASLSACEGRFRDLEAQERIDLSVSAYMAMAADKSGALVGCALQIGSLVGGADDKTAGLLAQCGEKLGIALQVRSDLAALWGRDDTVPPNVPNVEVLNKKKLIPVVYALENASISEKRAMGEIYFKRVLDADDAIRLREVVEGLGARDTCEEIAQGLLTEAMDAIDDTTASTDGKALLRARVADLGGAR